MTKEKFLYGLNACAVTYHNGQKLYEHDELVKCFEDLGLFEQEPCEDTISRQAVLDGIDTYINKAQSTGTQDDFYSFAELVVKQLPSVNPKESRTGHWIDSGIYGEIDGQITKVYICSKCGAMSIFRVSDGHIINADNCPNCGANMQEEEE